jgi:hypothetical protein
MKTPNTPYSVAQVQALQALRIASDCLTLASKNFNDCVKFSNPGERQMSDDLRVACLTMRGRISEIKQRIEAHEDAKQSAQAISVQFKEAQAQAVERARLSDTNRSL